MSLRLSYRPVTLPLPTITNHYIPLLIITHRYRDRPSATDTIPLPYRYSP
jgi:hypothetical protein